MSETNLNVNISARDKASGTIRSLQAEVKRLQDNLSELASYAANASEVGRRSFDAEIAKIQQVINARQEQIASLKELTAATRAQAQASNEEWEAASHAARVKRVDEADLALIRARQQEILKSAKAEMALATAAEKAAAAMQREAGAAAVLHQTLQQGAGRTAGIGTDRRILSASASASTLGTSLSAAAAADAYRRDQEHLAAIEAQKAATRGYIDELDQIAAKEALITQQILAAGAAETARKAAALQYSTTQRELTEMFREQAALKAAAASHDAWEAAAFGALQGRQTNIDSGLEAQRAAEVRKAAAAEMTIPAAVVAQNNALQKQMAMMDRMAADRVALQRSLSIPNAAAASAAPLAVPAFLMKQKNALGEFELAAKATAARAGAGAGLSFADNFQSMLQRESRHIVGFFDSMVRGQKGQALSSVGAGLRDAGTSAGTLVTSLTGLLVIMGGAAVLRGAEAMGKWATELKASASAAGMGVSQYAALQASMTGMGFKADEANASLRHLAGSVGNAIGNPTKLTAQAFHNLGISQKELVASGGDAEKVLRLLADAFVKTADTATKTDNMREILGQGFEKLIPLLQGGSRGMSDMAQKQKELGRVIDEDGIAKLEAAGDAVRHLGETITSGGMKAFIAWGPTIKATAEILESFVRTVMAAVEGIGKLANAMDIISSIPGPQWLRDVIRFGPLGIPIAMGRSGSDRSSAAGDPSSLFGAPAAVAKTVVPPLVRGGGGGHQANQAYRDFAAGEQLKIAEAESSSQKILAIYDEWLEAAKNKYKQHASEILKIEKDKVQAINKARLDEIKEGARQTEQNNQLMGYNAELSRMASGEGFKGQQTGPGADIKASQGFIAQAQQVQASAEAEIAALQKVASEAEQGSSIQKQAQQEIMSVLLQSKQQEVELYKKAGDAAQSAATKIAEPFKKLFDSIGSQFEQLSSSLINSIIAPQVTIIKAGLTSIRQSMRGQEIRQAASRLFTGIAQDLAKSVQDAIGKTIANTLSNGAANTISELLSQAMSKVFANITGNVVGSFAGNALGGAAGSAPVVAAIGVQTTTTVAGISTSVGVSAGLITSAIGLSTSAIVGALAAGFGGEDVLLGALNVKPSFLGFSYSQGGVVPSAAGGMVVSGGTGGQLSVLHEKEMVLPAPISQGIQQMIARGGAQGGNNANLNFAPTINTGSRGRGGTGMSRAEFMQMLSLHSGSMMGEARNMMRNGWRPA